MSWRLNIAPAMPNADSADWTIAIDATPEQVDVIADACHWHGLRVFAPAADDWRLARFMERLAKLRGISPDDSNVYVSNPGDTTDGGWIRI